MFDPISRAASAAAAVRSSSPVYRAVFCFCDTVPTPEANLWDWRFAPESIIVYLFVVNAKESAASDEMDCCVVMSRLTTN